MEVRVIRRPAAQVACMRETGPFMESANKAWQRLAAWLETVDAVNESTEFLGVMHDDPQTTPVEELRYDACLTLPDGFEAQDDLLLQHLPEGEYAVLLHVGPYENLGEAWGELMQWLEENGREVEAAPCFEVYRNDPRTTPPEALETELYLLLKSRQ